MNWQWTHRGIRALGLTVALFLPGVLGGCEDPRDGAVPRLTGGAPSLDALGRAVWTGLVARDTAALRRLRLTEHEHNELVWPEQPAAREPSAAGNLDLWWRNIEVRNRAALDALLPAFGGSNLELRGVECGGEPRVYETFRALTGCRLLLAGPEGPRRLEAFRYVIEMDGVHKVVRYYGDRVNPRDREVTLP